MGAGALGSVFGCLLRDKGHEVGLLEPSSRLDDVRELGLRATGLFGEHHCEGFALYASADDAPADYYDLVLIAVKSFHTAAAAKQIAPKVGGNASGEKGCGVVRGAPVVGVGDLSTLAGVEVVVELANRMGADGKYVCDCAVCVLVTHS